MNQSHEDAVRAFLGLFHTTALDFGRLRAALSPNARFQPIVPLSAPVIGADAICRELERQYQMYDECDCVILATASNGRQVFTERVDTVKQLSDGGRTTIHVAAVFELDDDNRIVSWREYWDALDVAGQIGVSGEEMRRIMKTDANDAAA